MKNNNAQNSFFSKLVPEKQGRMFFAVLGFFVTYAVIKWVAAIIFIVVFPTFADHYANGMVYLSLLAGFIAGGFVFYKIFKYRKSN